MMNARFGTFLVSLIVAGALLTKSYATHATLSCNTLNTTAYPISVTGAAVVGVGDHLYVFGGLSGQNTVATSYRISGSSSWTQIAPLPQPLFHAAAVTDGTNIFIVGGAANGQGQPTLYRYNVAANDYTTLTSFSTPTWGHAAMYLNGKIYKFAGTGPVFDSTNVLEIYDVATNKWSPGANYPIAVSWVGGFLHGSFLYGAGGVVSPGSVAQVKTYRYDPTANTWDDDAIADLPATRWGAAAGFYHAAGLGVLAGGYVNGNSSGNISFNVTGWDPASNAWNPLPTLPDPRARMKGASWGTSFHIIGGQGPSGGAGDGTAHYRINCTGGPTPTPIPTPTPTAQPTASPSATPRQLLNIATRLHVQTGENVLIGGLIVSGSDKKKIIVRAIGPSLSNVFDGALQDTTLDLFQGDTLLASNDNWKDSQQQEIEDTTIPPSHDRESAIVYTLDPGFYTAVLGGISDTTGIGVIEVYDLNQASDSKLVNIASRGFVEAGENVMIGGLIIGGNGTADARILLRAIGPSLSQAGVGGALRDPVMELRDQNGQIVRENDDWQDSQGGEIEATTIPPGDPAESAIVINLPSGNYTAVVRGKNGAIGIGVVEVYNLR